MTDLTITRIRYWAMGVVDLMYALLMAAIVCTVCGSMFVITAWLYDARGGALGWWFIIGIAFAVIGIAGLFLWERRR